MTKSDDMVIRPQLGTGPEEPRDEARRRADEERKTRRVRKKRGRVLRKLRRARDAASRMRKSRSARRGRLPGKSGALAAAEKTSKTLVRKAGSRAIPVVGWAMLLVDVLAIGTQLHRRFNGVSGRLLEAEDAHVVMGDLDEQAAANAEVLSMVEGDHSLLRAIGQDGKVNASTMSMIADMKKLALSRARGADMIERDPHFDSKDTLLDKLLMKFDSAGIKVKADTVIRQVRERGQGKMKSGR